VDGLLTGAALSVDGRARDAQGHPGGEPRGAGDVAGLGADGVDAAEDDVVDDLRVDTGAFDDRLDDVRAQVGRMLSGQAAAALADGRADGAGRPDRAASVRSSMAGADGSASWAS